jgi:hypothetical protein
LVGDDFQILQFDGRVALAAINAQDGKPPHGFEDGTLFACWIHGVIGKGALTVVHRGGSWLVLKQWQSGIVGTLTLHYGGKAAGAFPVAIGVSTLPTHDAPPAGRFRFAPLQLWRLFTALGALNLHGSTPKYSRIAAIASSHP